MFRSELDSDPQETPTHEQRSELDLFKLVPDTVFASSGFSGCDSGDVVKWWCWGGSGGGRWRG
ncbi:hypothetical protein Hanom_Chr13g01222221 [Helianthus anomalus]